MIVDQIDDCHGSFASKRYATIHEVAKRYGCSVSTVYRAISRGDLPRPIRIGGMSRMIVPEVLAAERHAAAAREIA